MSTGETPDFVVGDEVVLVRPVAAGGKEFAAGTVHTITATDDVLFPYLLDDQYRVAADQIELTDCSRYSSARLERRLGAMCGLETLGHLLGVMITQREVEADPEELIAWASEYCDMIWDDAVGPALDRIELMYEQRADLPV